MMENGLNNLVLGQSLQLPIFKVAASVRTSTGEKSQAAEDKASIPDQINWVKSWCEERGSEFVGAYVDTLPGDIEFDQRPDGARLLEDAKFKIFNLVLFYHSSRLAREPWIGLKTISLLGRLGVQVYIRNAPMEPVPPDKFVYGQNVGSEYLNALSLVGDKQENVARSERVTSGFKNLAQRGVLVFAPCGLKKFPKIEIMPDGRQKYTWHFEADNSKALVVKRIFDEYVGGKSLRKLAQGLIESNIPSPAGKIGLESWQPQTIKNILSDPAYIGKTRWGRKLGSKYRQGKSIAGKQKRVLSSSEKWILVPATNVKDKIIDEKIFNQVQDRLKLRGKVAGRQLASDSLLLGLVFCGNCGRRAHCKTRRAKKQNNEVYVRSDFIDQSYYRGNSCRRHLMSAAKLEHVILARLQSRLRELKKEDVEKETALRETAAKGMLVTSLNQVKRQLKSYDSKQTRLVELYTDGLILKEDFTKQKEKLDNEQTLLVQEEARLQALINDQTKRTKALKTLRQLLEMFTTTIDSMIRKEMIQRIIESIVIYQDKIEIVYKYDSEASESPNVNPCPCGFLGDSSKECICAPGQIARYKKRLSGPILDRIDLNVDVPAVKVDKLTGEASGETSEAIRTRVQKAKEIQLDRFSGLPISGNSEMGPKEIKVFCKLSVDCLNLLRAAISKMYLSARAYHRVLKVSRTIADLETAKEITTTHIAEALQYRSKVEG
ncbi:MAG: recombinase family protein [Candidatus Woykebacteria bacterium]